MTSPRSGSPATHRSTSATAYRPSRRTSLPCAPAMCGVTRTFGRNSSG
ncbi:hypothetical protein ACIO1C_15650 [Streptomyces sp. NPDC087420]